jgi:CheY-like chemotaxis protein
VKGVKTNKKILLVDDSEAVLMLERAILQRHNYELATASDGRDGIAKSLAFKPDVILMDLIMPNMSGFEALRELRRNKETRQIPIIIVTTKTRRKAWSPDT